MFIIVYLKKKFVYDLFGKKNVWIIGIWIRVVLLCYSICFDCFDKRLVLDISIL